MIATLSHPPVNRLQAFGLGRLSDIESAEIEEHLAACSDCQEVVENVPADSLVAVLQDPTPEAANRDETPAPGLYERLAAIIDPRLPKPAQRADEPSPRPPAAPHVDVPAELKGHPRYEILERLGAGGMGTVFKARHRLMDRLVALKVMNPRLLAEPAAADRFEREMKAAARLIHPHIVTAHDAERVDDLHFLVMEYVEGRTLAEVVQGKALVPVHLACEYVRQAALGLQFAHERGMVHRDIKPHNLVLTNAGQVKVLDFGLARFVSESGTPGDDTAFGAILGSPDYIAPEQAKNAHRADIRADIYSLGCTFYHLLAAQPPFLGGSAAEKISAHLEKMPTPVKTFRPDVPEGVRAVLDRMLAKDPEQRFQTPAEVATALEPFCKPTPVTPPGRDSLAPVLRGEGRQGLRRSNRSLRVWTAAVALLLVLGIGGFFYGAAIYRLATNQGTLVVETDDRDVEVIVKQGGEQVRIVDTKTGREVTLKAGEYQLELGAGKEGLKLSTNQFTLTRGGREIAKVWVEKTTTEPLAVPVPQPKVTAPLLADSSPKAVASKAGDSPAPKPPAETPVTSPPAAAPLAAEKPGSQPPAKPAVKLLEIRNLVGHRQQVHCVAVSSDGRCILSGSDDKTARLWDVGSGKEVRRLLHTQPVLSVALDPSGSRALTASGVEIRLWDVAAGTELGRFAGHTGTVQCVAFSADGRYVASGSQDTTVRVWEVEGRREHRLLAGHEKAVTSVSFSQDGSQVLSGSLDGTLQLWNIETRKPRRIGAHTSGVRGVALSPDGGSAFSGGDDFTLRLWDVATGDWRLNFTLRSSRSSATGDFLTRSGRLSSQVTCLALSPDGSRAVSGGGASTRTVGTASQAVRPDFRVHLWDVANGRELARSEDFGVAIPSVAFSGDGRFVAAGGRDKTVRLLWLAPIIPPGSAEPSELPKDRSLLVLEKDAPPVPLIVKQAGRLVTALSAKTTPTSLLKPGDYDLELAEQSDEFQLAVDKITLKAGAKQTVVIRRPSSSEKPAPAQLTEIRRFTGHTAGVLSVDISPDGKLALSAGRDKTVRLWDVASGQQLRSLEGINAEVWGIAFSPDGSQVLSGSLDKAVCLWDVTTGKKIRDFTGPMGGVECVAFSPDGHLALSGSADTMVYLWQVESGRLLRTFSGHESPVFAVAFSPDGRLALSGSWHDAAVRLWDVETGQELRQLEGHTEPVTQAVFSPDGRLALTGSADKTMRLWDVASGMLLRTYSHPTVVCCAAISPDGRRAVCGSGNKTTPSGGTTAAGFDYTVRLWDLASGQVLAHAEGFAGAIDAAAFAPDGRSVLVGSNDTTLRLLKLPEPPSLPITEVRSFAGHTGGIVQAELSPDGRHALSCSLDQTVRLWDVTGGKEVRRFEGYDEIAGCVAFSRDGRLALSGGAAGTAKEGQLAATDYSIRLWDIGTGKEIRRFLGHTSQASLHGVAFTSDGRQILSAGGFDSVLRLWDAETGRVLRVFQGHTGAIRWMALSADGHQALSGGDDKTVRLWDVATGRELRRLEGHTASVWSVALSPDGRRALSCGGDKTIRLWDLDSGQQLRLVSGHALEVECVAFSPNGRLALSAARDRTVRLWDLATGQELGRFDGFANWVKGVTFSSDGQSALVWDADGTMRLLKLPAADDNPKPVASGDTGQLALDSEAADGWLLVKQRDKVVLVLNATANQTAELNPGEYQLELAGRTDGLRLSVDKLTLAKGTKQVVHICRESKPARVEITEVRSFDAHMSFPCSVALSRDGRYALTGGRNTVRLWDVASGKELRRFEGHTRTVLCVALSPDGRRALSAGGGHWGETRPPSDLEIRLWDTATGRQIGRLQGHTSHVCSVTFSADGRFAISGSIDATARVWDVETGKQVHCFEGGSVQSASISPDGRWALSAHWNGTARLWDMTSGKEVRTFAGQGWYVWSVAFSPDASQVLTSSSDRTVRLWDRETGQILRSFPHRTGAFSAAFFPDGRRILTGGGLRVNFDGSYSWALDDYRVRVWDVSSGQEVGSFDGLPIALHGTAFSADGRFALVGAGATPARLLWFSETGKGEKPAGSADASQLEIETNGFDLPIIVKQPDKLVTVIVPKISTLADLPPGDYELELAGQLEDFRLSADKMTLTKGQKQTISILEVPPETPPHEITEVRRFEGHTAAIESVAFSPDGRWVLSGSQDKTVRLWDAETGKEVRQFAGNTQAVVGVAFSPDGRQAVSAGADEGNRDFAIRLRDVETGKELRRFTGHTDLVPCALFSPDGSRVLSCANDRTIRLWDVRTGTELRQFTGHESQVNRVAFAPDGRSALSGGADATIRLWDIETGKELRRFEGHTEWVGGLAFSPDGRQAVSCAMDRTIRLWDVETGRQLRSLSGCRTSENFVIFSPDGRRILTGTGWRAAGRHAGFDYGVRLRDVTTGEILGCFEGHRGPVVTVAFSPDGRTALSAGCDNVIRLLQLPEPDSAQGGTAGK